MGTFTAQILAGVPHLYHGGIIPTHYLFLSENSRPSWTLVNQNVVDRSEDKEKPIVWIPSVENMLEDALVMVAIHVIKNKQIIDLAQKMYKNIEGSHLELHENLTESQRREIYQECRRIENWPKMVITVMKGSSIKRQISVLKKYLLDAEICISK
jgi:hypothetical protein